MTAAPLFNPIGARRREREQQVLNLAARPQGVTYPELEMHFMLEVTEAALCHITKGMRARGLLEAIPYRSGETRPRLVFYALKTEVPPRPPTQAERILKLLSHVTPLTTRQVALALGMGPQLAAVHLHGLRLAGRLQAVPWSGREALLTRRHGHAYALADKGGAL
ncbi:hypothetical protein D3875_03065 [Deinococcus cavernae]|uniref:Uncharacterized protein n=1 Tax=Deinococcus cavernae TaxID=2320857 RepID=A0A418VFW3_9DEIO|nr:hypothetical protein [Deinococcus cavernae]RJF74993.1 hypothetical protein D3875_03065 [Deinococcus cavernae]